MDSYMFGSYLIHHQAVQYVHNWQTGWITLKIQHEQDIIL